MPPALPETPTTRATPPAPATSATAAPAERRDRRAALADAAIDLLAEEGMRALTHRAVDTRAGFPQGTTSAYFRTRHALLTAIVKRLSDLDREDLRAAGLDLASAPRKPRKAPTAGPPSDAELTAIVQGTVAFIDASLSRTRNRALARYHCRLESVTFPELGELLAPHHEAAFQQTRGLLARAGVPDLDARARAYVAAIDGLIFARLVDGSPEPPGTARSRAALTTVVETLLAGALTG